MGRAQSLTTRRERLRLALWREWQIRASGRHGFRALLRVMAACIRVNYEVHRVLACLPLDERIRIAKQMAAEASARDVARVLLDEVGG